MNTQNSQTAATETTRTWGEGQQQNENSAVAAAGGASVMMIASPSALNGWLAVARGGQWETTQKGFNLSECRRYYPDAEVMTIDAFYNLVAEPWRTPVQEIDEARFTDQLEVMPPSDWQYPGEGLGQSFKSAECWSGDVTSIFVNVRERFFEFRDRKHLSHAAILARITQEVFDKEQA